MKIIIDEREPDNMEELFETFTSFETERIQITEKTEYPTGDYGYKDLILIERKTVSDLDSSFITNHIWEQMQKMRIWASQDLKRKIRLYIIGDLGAYNEHAKVTFEQRIGALESISNRYGISIFVVQTEIQMVIAIGKMCRMLDEGKMGVGREFQFLPAKNITLLEHLLGGINGIGKDRVKKIMDYIKQEYDHVADFFKPYDFIKALESGAIELTDIKGIGPKMNERIKIKLGVLEGWEYE